MRRKTKFILSRSLVAVLIAVTALAFSSCSLGQKDIDMGVKTVTVEVTHKSGEKTEHVIETTATNLGTALAGSGFVDGEDGQYGYYINAVDGEVADYDTDGAFWSITKDGEELFTGASETYIHDGEHYELTYTVFG